MFHKQLKISNLHDLNTLATALAKVFITPPLSSVVIKLNGDLGVGKTAFSKFLIAKLCFTDTSADYDKIISPTFNIISPYSTNLGLELWHMDFYRLKTFAELSELGIDEAIFTKICIIEWANKFPQLSSVGITLDFNFSPISPEIRVINITTEESFLITKLEAILTNFVISNDIKFNKYESLKS